MVAKHGLIRLSPPGERLGRSISQSFHARQADFFIVPSGTALLHFGRSHDAGKFY
jgi:hypothetical protein